MAEHRRAPQVCAECGQSWPCAAEAARAEAERKAWTAPCGVCGTRQRFGSPDKNGRVRLLVHRRRVLYRNGQQFRVDPGDLISNEIVSWTRCPGSGRTAHPGSD